MAQRLKVPGGLQTRGMFEPSTFNEERGTVEVTFTTGARGLRGGIFSPPYYEDLEVSERACDLSRLNNGAPYMDDHAYKRGEGGVRTVLGVVERAWIANGQGRALLRFSDREDVKPVKRDVQTGILRHVSVGYSVGKYEKTGEDGGIPILTARRWQPVEISQTPLAFDDAATVRSRPESESYEVEIDADAFITRSSTAPLETRTMPDPTTPITPATPAAPAVQSIEEAARAAAAARSQEAADRAATDARVLEQAMETESARQLEIRKLVARTELGDAFTEKLIRERTSLDVVRKLVLDHLAKRDETIGIDGHFRIGAGDDARDKYIRGAVAAIIQRAGKAQIVADAKKLPLFADHLRNVELDPGEFRGASLLRLARESLERRGESVRRLNEGEIVKRALMVRDAGMNTTSDFATLLETAVNKLFLGQYALTPVTWRRWCGVKSLNDFRASTFYRPGSFGTLDTVTEAGEIKHKNIPDGEKVSLTPGTKGNIIGITRRAIVNDDMGVFNDLAGNLGLAAAYTIESAAFALVTTGSGLGATMSDAKPVFDAAHANIAATGAMSVTTWDSAQSYMGSQKDKSGNVILDLTPAVLLCPKGLGFTAKKINAVADPTANINSAAVNPAAGMVRDIVATAQLTGTRHYFFADPAIYPAFAVGFIDGREAPTTESFRTEEYDGIQIKIMMDFAAGAFDYRPAVTCAGA